MSTHIHATNTPPMRPSHAAVVIEDLKMEVSSLKELLEAAHAANKRLRNCGNCLHFNRFCNKRIEAKDGEDAACADWEVK